MPLKIYINQDVPITNSRSIKTALVHAARVVGSRNKHYRVSVTFTTDQAIRMLNRRFRFRDKATDVLSFPMGEEGMLGDIIISVPTARKNAELFGSTLSIELKRLAVHGILHLFGYTHKTVKEKSIMSALADTILKAKG